MTSKISCALIGLGGIGKRWVRALSTTSGIKLSAVYDVDEDKAKQLAAQIENCAVFSNVKDLLAQKDIQAVIIATPHKFLANLSLEALRAGKHVLVEKPAGIKSTEVRRVVETAHRKNLRYMAGFNHRFHEGFVVARKIFDEGKIGKIIFIRARYGFGGRPGFEKEWRHNKATSGGGELIDQGVHMIDMARYFLGDFAYVCGFAENTFWNSEVDDNAILILKNKKRQMASISVSWTNWKPIHNFEIYGTKGFISVEGLGRKYGGGEKVVWGELEKDFSLSEKEIVCDSDPDKSLSREAEEFAAAIREGRDPNPSGKDALAALKIVEKVYGKK